MILYEIALRKGILIYCKGNCGQIIRPNDIHHAGYCSFVCMLSSLTFNKKINKVVILPELTEKEKILLRKEV